MRYLLKLLKFFILVIRAKDILIINIKKRFQNYLMQYLLQLFNLFTLKIDAKDVLIVKNKNTF